MTAGVTRWPLLRRVRIAVGVALAIVLLGGVWLWILYGSLSSTVLRQQQEHLRGVAQAGALAMDEPGANAPAVVAAVVAGTRLRATVVAADGEVLADTVEDPALLANHAGRPEVRAALDGAVGTARRLSGAFGREYAYVAVPATYRGASVALCVSEPAQVVGGLAAGWRRTGLLLLVAILVSALVVIERITAGATAAVSGLTASAKNMASGDLLTPVRPERGDLGALSDALNDLGRQMRMRIEDLQAERHHLRTALDGLADGVFLLHGDTVRFENRAARNMLRAPVGGRLGRRVGECGLPACVAEAVSRAADRDGVTSQECPPDATGRVLHVTVIALEQQEEDARTLVVVADLTERARLDQIRRDFVSNASHELKTPTAGIQLLAESVAAAAADGDTARAIAFAEQIEGEASRLRRLVLDLLDLSRLEAAAATNEVTDVRSAVDLVALSHRGAAADAGLELAVDLSAIAGADVYAACHATDLAIALDNLLANAIAYTERGAVTLKVTASDDEVAIAVADTGTGISAEDLPRVFERFYRADPARSRATGGTGLGLSLVRHAVERSGGSVSLESEVGRGTAVTLRLRRVL